ncbi:InsB [Shigella sonnei]|nr:InsB [Shigella sonnei]CST13382.1 InsB [Shigella sonnei]SIY16350.1 InsB [Shigella sonnei]SIY44789.1 InsB [Shigella sonnei]SIY61639.1 InsB [Shigella sonnei]
MLGGADNPNGELPSYITGADRAAWNNIPGITYMLLMTVLIPTFPPKKPTQHE